MRHDPVSSDGYRENAVDLYYMARRYEDVIAVFRGWRNPPLHVYAGLAAAYAQNGQPEEAKAALETCLRELPENTGAKATAKRDSTCENSGVLMSLPMSETGQLRTLAIYRCHVCFQG